MNRCGDEYSSTPMTTLPNHCPGRFLQADIQLIKLEHTRLDLCYTLSMDIWLQDPQAEQLRPHRMRQRFDVS
jgi:hypothetical protein